MTVPAKYTFSSNINAGKFKVYRSELSFDDGSPSMMYVGSSADPVHRVQYEHRLDRRTAVWPFFSKASRVHTTLMASFDTRDDAVVAEKQLIGEVSSIVGNNRMVNTYHCLGVGY